MHLIYILKIIVQISFLKISGRKREKRSKLPSAGSFLNALSHWKWVRQNFEVGTQSGWPEFLFSKSYFTSLRSGVIETDGKKEIGVFILWVTSQMVTVLGLGQTKARRSPIYISPGCAGAQTLDTSSTSFPCTLAGAGSGAARIQTAINMGC